jgi:PIN domain nuclease of toxin-antitoxin system
MTYLLDTHSFLWAIFSPEKLSSSARETIKDRENKVAVSVVTFWEVSLKYALGKLDLVKVKPEDLPGAAEKTGIDVLQITPQEAASFHNLPRGTHKDPFDRLIIWQAIQRNMPLISRDQEFKDYRKFGLKIHW